MPIPTPQAEEEKADFMDRCMGDSVMVDEFPDDDQRMAVCSVQTEYETQVTATRETNNPKMQRISFQRRALKRKGRYVVDQKKGTMEEVSLIQIGEAKGHGMWIDKESLESALDILEGARLPAYVTHEGALDSDRLLSEVGVFSGFYVQEGKLKAEKFQVLESFRADESERYRRLFDVAEAMPDAFGLSMVFEASLVWVQEDGTEVPIDEGSAENSLRDLPSVRFISIKSADFVDQPAANEGGLFSQPPTKHQGNSQMSEKTEIKTEKVAEEIAAEVAEEVIEDVAEVATEEEPEEVTPENDDSQADELAAQVEELQAKVEAQSEEIAKLKETLEASEGKAANLSALLDDGVEALEEGNDSTGSTPTIFEQFAEATGPAKTRIWKQNKQTILDNYRRS
mgnify:FL=1|tara:strand:- start:881 stop:2074 length:1194 start_codon:yes stop_codon:yes gene_type:complete